MRIFLNLNHGNDYAGSSADIAGSLLTRSVNTADETGGQPWERIYSAVFHTSAEVDMPPSATTADVIRAAIEAFGLIERPGRLHDDQAEEGRPFERLFLFHNATLSVIGEFSPSDDEGRERNGQKLEDLGYTDGELIEVVARYDDGSRYYMLPVQSSDLLMAQFASVDGKPPDRILLDGPVGATRYYAQRRATLFAALLYTNEDKDLATYVREHFSSLDILSGGKLCVYVVERPSAADGVRYWKDAVSEKLYRLWAAMGWSQRIPYDKAESYKIADLLGVDRRSMPCLVLFDRIERSDKLVFPVREVSPAYFRNLFEGIDEALQGVDILEAEFPLEPLSPMSRLFMGEQQDGEDTEQRRHQALETVRLAFEKIAASLVPQPSADPNTYHFYGETVFIANPKDTVIKDFLNSKPEPPPSQENG